MENGDYVCKRRRRVGREEHKYISNVPTDLIAEAGIPIDVGDVYPTSSWDSPFLQGRSISSYERAPRSETIQTLVTTTTHDYDPSHSTTNSGRAKPVPTEIAALTKEIRRMVKDTANTPKIMCGFCINMQGRRSELNGVNVCNTLANDAKYRACSNLYCGICIIFE